MPVAEPAHALWLQSSSGMALQAHQTRSAGTSWREVLQRAATWMPCAKEFSGNLPVAAKNHFDLGCHFIILVSIPYIQVQKVIVNMKPVL